MDGFYRGLNELLLTLGKLPDDFGKPPRTIGKFPGPSAGRPRYSESSPAIRQIRRKVSAGLPEIGFAFSTVPASPPS